MDDWSYTRLSTKVRVKCFEKDATIFEKGAPSDYTYIVLLGSVLVSIELVLLRCIYSKYEKISSIS